MFLDTTKRSLSRWIDAYPEAPKTSREPEDWLRFMKAHGLGKFSLRQDAPLSKAVVPSDDATEERALRIRERKLQVDRAEYKLQKETGAVLPLAEFQAALMKCFGGFNGALKQMPGRAAEQIALSARNSFLAALRAIVPAKQFEKIETALQSASIDYGTVARILDDEIDLIVTYLGACEFIPKDGVPA